MQSLKFNPAKLSPATREFYQHALATLHKASVPFLVGGSYAVEAYTSSGRQVNDLDVFVCPPAKAALTALAEAGYNTELVFPHWLAKVGCGADFIDIIFSSGNGLCGVDETWFAYSVDAE